MLTITRLEDLVKLKELAKLCSEEFFNDVSLLVVAWRRIMEVLELAIPEEKNCEESRRSSRGRRRTRGSWRI